MGPCAEFSIARFLKDRARGEPGSPAAPGVKKAGLDAGLRIVVIFLLA
jgi:hypothetical protein